MKAIVTGMIGAYPVGGVAYDYGHYLVGLQQLGFEVLYLEDTGIDCYDPDLGDVSSDPAYAYASSNRPWSTSAPTGRSPGASASSGWFASTLFNRKGA